MKQKFKLLVATVTIIAVFFSMCVVTFASANEAEVHCLEISADQQGIVAPMGMGCGSCGVGFLVVTNTQYSPWVYNGYYTPCTTHYSCAIKRYERKVMTTYLCNYCRAGYTTTTTQYDYRHSPV